MPAQQNYRTPGEFINAVIEATRTEININPDSAGRDIEVYPFHSPEGETILHLIIPDAEIT